jgi:putative MATE family efflux protein
MWTKRRAPTIQPVGIEENASRVVWQLAWPAVALNSLQVVNSLLDSAFVGHLQPAALTAYGGAINVLFLMFSLAMALGTSATALVSRAYGADRHEELRQAARQCVSLALVGGFALLGVAIAMAPGASRLLLPPDDPEAISLMIRFLGLWATSIPALYLIQVLAGSLRGVGDTKSPMVISGIQILLHIVLNFILIFPPRDMGNGIVIPGFDMGLMGAALSMSISAWFAAIVYLLFTGRTPIGEQWRIQIPIRNWVNRILKIAIPAATMSILRVLSMAAFTIILRFTPQASEAIGGMRVAFSVEGIMFMPSFGLSMAAAALVGQSLGMGRPDRAEKLAWTAAHYAAAVTLALVVPIFVGADYIANLMIKDQPEYAYQAALLVRYLCVTEVFFAYAMVVIGAMQGAGDTVRPLWITIVSAWILRVPLAFLLALPFGFGSVGAWIAMSVTQAIQGILAMWVFRQGKWKEKEV